MFPDCCQCWLQVERILVFANCSAKCRAMFLAYVGMCLASRRLGTIALCALRRGTEDVLGATAREQLLRHRGCYIGGGKTDRQRFP